MIYFTKEEATKKVIETLENGYEQSYSDLYDVITGYTIYLDSEEEALQALEQYGIFEALGEIQVFLKLYGESWADLSSAEGVGNALWDIKINDAIASFPTEFFDLIEKKKKERREEADPETNTVLAAILRNYLTQEFCKQ